MNFTYFLLPLSILKESTFGSDQDGGYLLLDGIKIYRLHLIGTVVGLKMEENSGYAILDDTFSSILVLFQSAFFKYFENIKKGDMVEVLGTIDVNTNNPSLILDNIKKINLDRYMYNKLESLRNLKEIKDGVRRTIEENNKQ